MMEKVSIVKYLNGGVTLEEIDRMPLDEYQALKYAVTILMEKEKKELEKAKK